MNKLAGLLLLLAAGTACAADPASGAGERGAAQADAIAFWSAGYTGAEFSGADFGCPPPALTPVLHAEPQAARGADHAIEQWEQCHREFMATLGAAQAEARIPADVLAAMTPAERAQARAHVQAVHARIAAAAQAHAASTMARHATWRGASVEHIVQEHVTADSRRGAVRKATFTSRKP